ncbi:MAG: Hsp20/alpha crystallin family protein [Nevskia sp.]|jgi:HSP20 family protein|nr:Hsp20/alpha crystallin family protein [Nevskia sp.]MCK9385312.1 Hsp20/alpha crystallin family protein [Nevskia sp.]
MQRRDLKGVLNAVGSSLDIEHPDEMSHRIIFNTRFREAFMTTLIRYQPWALHRELFNQVNRFAAQATDADGKNDAVAANWVPAVDVEEFADRLVLRADVPGVDPASIEVTLEKGVLTLRGERGQPAAAEGAERQRIERASGRFLRQFSLPDSVDAEGITAHGNQGVLEVVIPKKAAVQARRIAVSH